MNRVRHRDQHHCDLARRNQALRDQAFWQFDPQGRQAVPVFSTERSRMTRFPDASGG